MLHHFFAPDAQTLAHLIKTHSHMFVTLPNVTFIQIYGAMGFDDRRLHQFVIIPDF